MKEYTDYEMDLLCELYDVGVKKEEGHVVKGNLNCYHKWTLEQCLDWLEGKFDHTYEIIFCLDCNNNYEFKIGSVFYGFVKSIAETKLEACLKAMIEVGKDE